MCSRVFLAVGLKGISSMCSRVVFSFCWLERESLPCAQGLSFLGVSLKGNLFHVLKSCLFFLLA